LDSENTRTYGREIFAGGKERARRQPWKGCRGRATQPAARAAGTAGREATSREKIRPDAASDHREAEQTSRREAEIRHGIYGGEHLVLSGRMLTSSSPPQGVRGIPARAIHFECPFALARWAQPRTVARMPKAML